MPKKTTQEVIEPIDGVASKESDNLVKLGKSKSLLEQVNSEYDLAYSFMKPKIDLWATRLKLYNNQRRDMTAVGDPLMFTIHQTVLAALYDDKLNVEFLGRDEGDEETAENLNRLADFDYDEMLKDENDYEWDWDSSFFGRGLLLAMEFDRKLKCPIQEVINPMCWLRDPRATSVNGDRKGRNAMRFGGREIRLSKKKMKDAGVYFDFDDLKSDATDSYSLFDNNNQLRSDAQGTGDTSKVENLKGDNADMRLVEWFTMKNGKRLLVTLADSRKKIIRVSELGKNYWPIIDRPFYPISHNWDGVSISDLTEDKQRARSIVTNLALAGVKTGQHPTYLYNSNLIKNRGNLNIDFNKHIPVDGNPAGAIQMVDRASVKQEVSWILDSLDMASQKATATPDVQQGVPSEKARSATELNIQSSKVDTRYSLTAKVWGWSEKRFWRMGWYDLYKEHFKDGIDEKVIRISGAMGAKWRTLTRENIIASVDPDIKIESRVISEARKVNELQKYRLFMKDVMASDPQSANVRFGLRKIGQLSGMTKEEVEQVLPPTVDEMNSEEENMKLDNKEKVEVQVYDDDFVHMEMHNKASDTPQKKAHIEAHRKSMMLKRVKPQLDMARNRPENPLEAPKSPSVGMPSQMPGIPTNPS